MKQQFGLIPLLIVAFSVNFYAQNALVNFPSLSPNGQKIAFNYQGDIWTADVSGENARRLTVHEGYDTKPLWSADGKTIAFESNRYGNNDIYLIPTTGGLPKRLTYHSTTDNLTQFTSNGTILFASKRDFAQVERGYEVQVVKTSGGTPYRLMDALGYDAMLSPNGKFIAFTKGGCRISREAYNGPANKNVWLYDIENDTYTQLTTFKGNDFYPQWGDNNTIYFQSSRSGKYNVHELKLDTKTITPVTTFTNMGIFSFHVSKNGKDIVVAQADHVFLVNTESKTQKSIALNLNTDYRFDPVEHKTYTNNISEVAISPNGKYSALVIRGEIFIKENDKDKKRAVNASKSSNRDRMPAWLNDSTLVFVSDRNGENDLYLLKSGDENQTNLFKTLKHSVERLTKTDAPEENPIISPNGKQIAYTIGRGKLVVANINEKGKISNQKTLLDGWDTPSNLAWSPDSKWLAYGLQDLDFNSEIYIHKADNSQKPVNISMHPNQDRNPVWSLDGKKLMFSSNRNNNDYDVWFTWLNKTDWEKTDQDWAEETDEGDKKSSDKKDNKNETDEVAPIIIDFEDIHERQVQVTAFIGGEFGVAFSKDAKTIYYTTGDGTRGDADVESDLFKISWEGKHKQALTTNNSRPGNITTDKNLSTIYFTKNRGMLSSLNLGNNKTESLPFSAKLDIDYNAESNQLFEEGWKAINDGFYDPNFHGQDWDKLKSTYKPLAMKASTRIDFQEMFNWMLGQINASHMGFRSATSREELQRESTGLLGVEFMPNKNGSLKVVSVTKDMPASRTVSTLMANDVITSINGVDLDESTNAYSLFEGTSNDKVYLNVKRDSKTIEVVIRPKSSNRYENYNAWVKERQRLTDKYSNGRLGYIHIQGMNWTSFERFERELTAAGLGKEGIVIDVRYNGGGWTTDYLMAVLNVKQHAYTVPRGAATNLEKEQKNFSGHYPYSERLPLAAWTKPSVALCNHASYSNAEIFSHAYKSLGIGTLVGEPTFGAVISTGAARLIDGSYVRMPYRGWYVKATGENMELGPAVPDIFVLNQPDEKAKGTDTQLKTAVETLLKQL